MSVRLLSLFADSSRFSRCTLSLAVAIASLMLTAPAGAEENAVQLPAVKVRSDVVTEGSSEQGYRVESVRQLGPLGEVELLDTPFSLNVISSDLIENVQASKPDDVFRINPVIQLNNPQSRFFSGVTLRGFSVASTKRIDGIPSTSNYVNVDIEDKERIEVITGLSGFLYGTGNVGGTLNYVLKRPTYQPLAKVRAGVTEGENAVVQGDFGGALDDEQRFAYRLNALYQDGDTALDHQSINRKLVSGALDWNISDDVKLQFDASQTRYRMAGSEPYWATSTGVAYPSAPDADEFWGQPFTQTESEQERVGVRLTWNLSDDVALRTGVARYDTSIDLTAANNTFLAGPTGTYQVQASNWEYPDVEAMGGFALFDVRFDTGGIEHLLTTGWYGDRDERTNFRSSPGGWTALTSAPVTLDQGPVYFDVAVPRAAGAKYRAQRSKFDNWVLGDQITFNDQWSALLGVNRASIEDTSYSASGAAGATYDDDSYSPSAALMYKPLPSVTVYMSYAESLEKGGTAPITSNGRSVVNAGEVMPPLESEQIEFGAKAQLGGVLLTAALFDIDKGLQYTENLNALEARYVQDGRQVHKGFEFTATGRLLDGLTVLGGVTLLDAQVEKNASNPALEGKTPTNVAETLAKLYVEYDIAAVPGLTLTGGVYYTGEQQVDTLNTDAVPSYTTFDLGGRYSMEAAQVPLVFRVGFANVTGEEYWLTPNSLGRPRTLAASIEASFF